MKLKLLVSFFLCFNFVSTVIVIFKAECSSTIFNASLIVRRFAFCNTDIARRLRKPVPDNMGLFTQVID